MEPQAIDQKITDYKNIGNAACCVIVAIFLINQTHRLMEYNLLKYILKSNMR